MRAHKVDLSLRDGSHSDLIKGTSEEGGESAAEDDVSVPASETDSYSTQVLLCDEALDIAIGEGLLVGEREGGVFGVSIKSNNAIKTLSEFHEGISVCLASGNLEKREKSSVDNTRQLIFYTEFANQLHTLSPCLTFSPSL